MSGIAGFFRLDGGLAQAEAIEAMLATLRRRGPDRQSCFAHGPVALGQALLATTPEARADVQPWCHPEDGCLVVADARFDNRPQLLRELGVEGDPDRIGDGRLLHAAWRRWGEDCVHRLLGDFAFVLWDAQRQRLFCARDTAGIRPFYYHHAPGKVFAFASEAEALLALPEVPRQFNEARMGDVLVPRLQGFDCTSTFFSQIQRLPPAHVLAVTDSAVRSQRYWTPVSGPAPSARSEQEWIEGLRAHLEEAVRCRLRADVGVGSMLSGGLDSSSLVAIASRELTARGTGRLPTFSAVSSEPDCLETRAIRQMQAAFDLDATCLDWRAVPELLDQIARDWPWMGEPFDGGMAMVECQYRAAAARGVKVVFDGLDADSLLYEGHYLADLLRRGRWSRAWAEAVGQTRFYREGWSAWSYLQPELVHAFVPERLRDLLRRFRQPRLQAERLRAGLVAPEFAVRTGLRSRMRELARRLARLPAVSDDGRAQSWIIADSTTAGLERYGRMAARQGVEARHPFMDRRLVEYCAWMPPALRLRDGWPKWVLRQAMADCLPRDVAWRQGKEHLGWRFSQALFARIGQHHPVLGRSGAAADALGIDPAALPLWTPPGADVVLPEDWEARLTAAALVVWRQRVDSSGR